MKLWIDTEFNDYRGELISMALVDEQEREWYEVTFTKLPYSHWVARNIVPVIGKQAITIDKMRDSIYRFLSQYDRIHIIADWPEDLQWFCWLIVTGPGIRIETPPLTMEVKRTLDSATSAVPHNALEDAKAIRLMDMNCPAMSS